MTDDGNLAEPGDDFSANVIANIFEVFITPEVERRGGYETLGPLRKALVVFPPQGRNVVLLNDEAEVVATVRATRAIERGEEITTDDFDLIQDLRPGEVDEEAGWIVLAAVPGGGWMAAFDFRRNRGRGRRFLALADDYMATAREAQKAKRFGPSLDAAHTAAELAVTAMMYLFEDNPLAGKRNRHGKREGWLRSFAKHGNIPDELHGAMASLGRLRSSARYGEPELEISDVDHASLLDAVEALLEHARQRVGEPLPALHEDVPEVSHAPSSLS